MFHLRHYLALGTVSGLLLTSSLTSSALNHSTPRERSAGDLAVSNVKSACDNATPPCGGNSIPAATNTGDGLNDTRLLSNVDDNGLAKAGSFVLVANPNGGDTGGHNNLAINFNFNDQGHGGSGNDGGISQLLNLNNAPIGQYGGNGVSNGGGGGSNGGGDGSNGSGGGSNGGGGGSNGGGGGSNGGGGGSNGGGGGSNGGGGGSNGGGGGSNGGGGGSNGGNGGPDCEVCTTEILPDLTDPLAPTTGDTVGPLAVPEPAAFPLLALGLAILSFARRKKA